MNTRSAPAFALSKRAKHGTDLVAVALFALEIRLAGDFHLEAATRRFE